jgi:uncharacterized OsmC-like protein
MQLLSGLSFCTAGTLRSILPQMQWQIASTVIATNGQLVESKRQG